MREEKRRAKKTAAPVARRTQEERRGATIQKILDAATASLVANGYAKTTVQEVCKRAGISQGGLFRHFPTMDALMAKVGEHVGAKLIDSYRRRFAREASGGGEPLITALRLVRDHTRSRDNQAFYELFVAARTNDALRAALEPVAAHYYPQIIALGEELMPELAAALGPRFGLLVSTILMTFDGETIERIVGVGRDNDDERLALVAEWIAASVRPFVTRAERGRARIAPR
jgi:AcrR family transcriptional regulator